MLLTDQIKKLAIWRSEFGQELAINLLRKLGKISKNCYGARPGIAKYMIVSEVKKFGTHAGEGRLGFSYADEMSDTTKHRAGCICG